MKFRPIWSWTVNPEDLVYRTWSCRVGFMNIYVFKDHLAMHEEILYQDYLLAIL